MANIYRKEEDNEAAIECYRRALALDYGQIQWRYTMARLLACYKLDFKLHVPTAEKPIWLAITGPEGTKSFLTSILDL